jgi:transcriptional regulator MraZ
VGSKSVQVALDKAGRICLPDEMAGAAGIKGEAVLVGLIDLFEIWNPARHEQVEAMDTVLSSKAFEMME